MLPPGGVCFFVPAPRHSTNLVAPSGCNRRQPGELAFSVPGYTELLTRVSRAAGSRFPPWQGLVIGLTAIVMTAEPIGPDDDAVLGRVLGASFRRFRAVPFGLIRVNMGQEAVAFSLRGSPGGIFSEPALLADRLTEQLRRFVPPLEFS